jgi:anti-sigma regulatory factor (Ser/Thr protein kinase)
MWQQGDSVGVSIEDDGRAYNPLAATLAPLPSTLAEAQIGGLGVRLILGIAADCGYRRDDDKNILSFTIRA